MQSPNFFSFYKQNNNSRKKWETGFDRASSLNSFGFSTTFVPYLVRFHSNLKNPTTGHCFSKYLLTQSREVLKSYCPESRGNWAVSKTPSTISLASPHVECWICHTTFQKKYVVFTAYIPYESEILLQNHHFENCQNWGG